MLFTIKHSILFALAASCFGATVINSVTLADARLVIDVTAPDGTNPCKFEVSESNTYSPLVHDVNPTLFTGADLDTRWNAFGASRGVAHRVFTAGTKIVSTAANGRKYSRSLAPVTMHYIRVSCGAAFADVATTTKTTAAVPVGRSVRNPWLTDSARNALWPDFSMTDATEVINDPMSGVKIKHFGMPADALVIYNDNPFGACLNLTSGWTIGTSCTASSGTASTFTSASCTTACAWLWLGKTITNTFNPQEAVDDNRASVNYIRLHITGLCSGADTASADCKAQICWTWNGSTCAGSVIDVDVPTSSSVDNVVLCSTAGSACTIGDLLGADYRQYLYATQGTGYLSTSGSDDDLTLSSSADGNLLRVGDVIVVTDASLTQHSLTVTDVTGAPSTVKVNTAVTLDPSAYTNSPGFPFHYYSGLYFNPRWGYLVRKKSLTANNTISLDDPKFDVTLGGYVFNTSSGMHEYCSQYIDASGFRKCRAASKILALHPTTGEVRFLGQFYGTGGGGNGLVSGDACQPTGGGSTNWIDANSFYCMGKRAADNKPSIFKVEFTGDTANDVAIAPTPPAVTSFVAGSTVTNISGDVLADVAAFDATFDTAVYFNQEFCGYTGGRYGHMALRRGSQDTFGWQAVYDFNTDTVIAAWPTWIRPAGSRWSVQHNCLWIAPNDNAAASVNLFGSGLKQGRDDTVNGGRYHFTIAENINNSVTTFNISTTTPISPVAPTTLMAILAGDSFVCGGDNGEAMDVSVVNSTTNITVTRGVRGTSATSHNSSTDCAMKPNFNYATNINAEYSGQFWAFTTETAGPSNSTLGNNFCPGGGHAVNYAEYLLGSPNLGGNFISGGVTIGDFPICLPASFTQYLPLPTFSGSAYGVFNHEAHPSFKPTPYPLVVDNHPNIGGGLNTDSALTWVAGTLFRLTYSETFFTPQGDGLSNKFLPLLVTSQNRIFQDISGPASVITGNLADGNKYCIVVRAGECYAGSSVGQIYVNAPYINPAYYTNAFGVTCFYDSDVSDDLCLFDDGFRAETITGYVLEATESTVTNPNRSFPILEQWSMTPKRQGSTANDKLLWGNWVFGVTFAIPPTTFGYRTQGFIAQVPTTDPTDATDRTVYATSTVTVSSVPAMTDNVLVRYGFDEYGTDGTDPWTEHYCRSRRDKCLAYASTINASVPFKWTAEGSAGTEATVTGLSCAVSCTVAVPTIPGYVVYPTLIYRDVSNNIISTLDLPPGGGTASPIGTGGAVTRGTVTIRGGVMR